MLGPDSASMARAYKSMGHLLESGVGMLEGLSVLAPTATPLNRQKIVRLQWRLSRGFALAPTMKLMKYPQLDIALVELGEETGSLPASLKFLGDTYDQRSQIETAMQGAAVLPIVLITFSILIKRLGPLISGLITGRVYLQTTIFSLSVFAALIGFSYLLMKQPERFPRSTDALLRLGERVPHVRQFLKRLAMYRFFLGLWVCVRAGYDIKKTFSLAGNMTSDRHVRRAAAEIPGLIDKYGLAGALSTFQAEQVGFSKNSVFDDAQISQILVGEESGRLDQCLEGITKDFKNQIEISIGFFKHWAPRILYGICLISMIFN